MTQLTSPEPWTIDELASLTGTTSRNVRAFQSRGLLPSPQLAGRTGRYDNGHRIRLDAILRLQRRGYSLAAIGDLLATWKGGGTLDDVLGLEAPPSSRPSRRSRTRDDADVIFLDELRDWRVPSGNAFALLPGPVLRSWEEPSRN